MPAPQLRIELAIAAAADAIGRQPTGTPAAHMARMAIEAAAPVIRHYDRTEPCSAKSAITQAVPVPAEVTADDDGTYHARLGRFGCSGWKTADEAKAILGRMIAEAVTRAYDQWRPAFARDRAGTLIIACPVLGPGCSLRHVTATGATHLGHDTVPAAEAIIQRGHTPLPHQQEGS